MEKKQDIVPVRLSDNNNGIRQPQKNYQNKSQKLVARLKCSDSELSIYEGIREPILQVLLTELYTNENH